jgi:hypothetical protein
VSLENVFYGHGSHRIFPSLGNLNPTDRSRLEKMDIHGKPQLLEFATAEAGLQYDASQPLQLVGRLYITYEMAYP